LPFPTHPGSRRPVGVFSFHLLSEHASAAFFALVMTLGIPGKNMPDISMVELMLEQYGMNK
jgi:hypothetical protein